jgi:hypothetical protein
MESDGESRAHPRAQAQIKVEYHHGTTTGVGYTDNISEGGIYLMCDHPASPGTRVYLRLHLPGSDTGDPVKLIGVATRSTYQEGVHDPDTSPGMAISFEVAYSRTKEQLHDFMAMIFDEASAGGTVARLDDEEAPSAYVARFPEVDGQARARTIPPRELDAAFSFTSPPSETEPPPEAPDDGATLRIAVVVVAAVLVVIVALQAMGGC